MFKTSNRKTEASVLTVSFLILSLIGYVILQNQNFTNGTETVFSMSYLLIWLLLLFFAAKQDQWVPLLISTAYWLCASLVKLYLSYEEEGERAVAAILDQFTKFASQPLSGMGNIRPEAVLLSMAVLTLLSMVGLIVVLDKNKPKSDESQSDIYL